MFCSKCGREIEKTMDFCPNCGMENNKDEIKSNKTKVITKKKFLFVILAIIIAIVFIKNNSKVYEIGETAKIKDFNITLLDMQYGDRRSTTLSKEDYMLPVDNTYDGYFAEATPGNTYVTITYELEFTGQKPREIDFWKRFDDSQFCLVYNDDYTIKDADEVWRSTYVRNVLTEGSVNKEKPNQYASLWNTFDSEHFFRPFSDPKKLILREYIMVPKEIMEDENSSLILEKNLTGPNFFKKVKYRIR